MKQISRYLMTLLLLITAATGAWADWTGGTYTATTNEELGAIIVGADATLTINEGVTVTVKGGINANGHTLTVNGAGTLTVTGTNGADGANGGGFTGGGGGIGSAGFTGTLIVDGATVNVTGGNGGNGGTGLSDGGRGGNGAAGVSGSITLNSGSATVTGGAGGNGANGNTDLSSDGGSGGNGAAGVSGSITLNSGSATVTGGAGGNGGHGGLRDGSRGSAGQAVTETITASTVEESDDNSTWTAISGNTSSKRYVRAESTAPAVEVIINDTKTEASFTMPQYDVTATYTIKRDMTVDMTTTIGDGSNGYRIRLKKSEQNPGKYEPADMTLQEMMAKVVVHDAIEDYNLTFGIPGANCVVNIYAANENNQAEGNPIEFADLTPGRYIAKAVAATGSDYDGETAMSNIFELFEGFEVVVPAGEYATFYKDEPLYADPVTSTDAELYTITSVSGDKAILSNAIETAPSGTPLLVYNKGTEEKTFLLIPANAEPNLALDVYDGFIGTMQPTVIPASNATTDNYAFNGKQFVWVMNEIAIGANKAYLSIPKTNGNPKNIRIYRGNGEATGIDESIVNSEDMNSVWYDLNGRKLQGKPSLKGVYIKNGKKVVVK